VVLFDFLLPSFTRSSPADVGGSKTLLAAFSPPVGSPPRTGDRKHWTDTKWESPPEILNESRDGTPSNLTFLHRLCWRFYVLMIHISSLAEDFLPLGKCYPPSSASLFPPPAGEVFRSFTSSPLLRYAEFAPTGLRTAFCFQSRPPVAPMAMSFDPSTLPPMNSFPPWPPEQPIPFLSFNPLFDSDLTCGHEHRWLSYLPRPRLHPLGETPISPSLRPSGRKERYPLSLLWKTGRPPFPKTCWRCLRCLSSSLLRFFFRGYTFTLLEAGGLLPSLASPPRCLQRRAGDPPSDLFFPPKSPDVAFPSYGLAGCVCEGPTFFSAGEASFGGRNSLCFSPSDPRFSKRFPGAGPPEGPCPFCFLLPPGDLSCQPAAPRIFSKRRGWSMRTFLGTSVLAQASPFTLSSFF